MLETEWETPDGSVCVIDLMPQCREAADVVRIVEGRSGEVRMRTVLRPRFDYGQVQPWVRTEDGDLVAVAGPDAVWLRTPVFLEERDGATQAEFSVQAGQQVAFVLIYGPSYRPRPRPVYADKALADTGTF